MDEHTYHVRFAARELWPEQDEATPRARNTAPAWSGSRAPCCGQGASSCRKTVEVGVRDTTAETRFIALPLRPTGTERWSEERLAEMEQRATDAESHAGAGLMDAVDALMDSLLPAEVRAHMRAARKEQLLAMRSMVDVWIERVDRKPEERRGRRHETIELDET